MEQLQCPKCGGYKVWSEEYIDPSSGKTLNKKDYKRTTLGYFLSGIFSWIISVGAIILSILLNPYINSRSTEIFGIVLFESARTLIAWGLLIFGCLIVLITLGINVIDLFDIIFSPIRTIKDLQKSFPSIISGTTIALNGWLAIDYFVLGIGLIIAVGLMLTFWGTYRVGLRLSGVWKQSHFCTLCGKRWVWESGDPLPEINDNPELRRLGEEQLRKRMWD